jgi:hypothetical protein
MKKLEKNGICMTSCNYWPPIPPNGCVQWLLPKLWTSSIRGCAWYCTGAPSFRGGEQKGQQGAHCKGWMERVVAMMGRMAFRKGEGDGK